MKTLKKAAGLVLAVGGLAFLVYFAVSVFSAYSIVGIVGDATVGVSAVSVMFIGAALLAVVAGVYLALKK